jgi:chromosome segregation ATPase
LHWLCCLDRRFPNPDVHDTYLKLNTWLTISIEKDVKKANRELASSISMFKDPLARAEAVQKKYSQLFGDMKRVEQEYQKAKRRGDQLQKEKDTSKSELGKMTTMKDRLEKLSRETSNENRKLRVSWSGSSPPPNN